METSKPAGSINMYKNKADYQYGAMTPNQIDLGNIDLDHRPINIVPTDMRSNPLQHFTVRTEESATINDGLGYANIPTIINGEKYSEPDAMMHYQLTGQHLGKYNGMVV